MMPLTLAGAGTTWTIKKITGQDAVRQHLAELGFVVGAPVTIVCEVGGDVIINVKDCRVALGKAMAGRILV